MRRADTRRRDPSRNEEWPNRAKRRATTRMRRRCRSRAGSPPARGRRRSRPISRTLIPSSAWRWRRWRVRCWCLPARAPARRARPGDILAVTFTNKAAREMKQRVGTMVGQIVEGMPWLGTFHSIGVKILRRHAELVGLKPDFTILDQDDQIRLLKQLLEAENIDEKRWPARVLAGLIDSWKNRGLTPDQVPAGEAASFAGGRGKKLYAAYQERLKVLNAADFGDLLLECIRLFREQSEVLRQYQARFRYILVDEYQDTNVAQYLWLRLLGQSTGPPHAPSPSPRLRGEDGERSEPGEGEAPSIESAPHPNPLPTSGGE